MSLEDIQDAHFMKQAISNAESAWKHCDSTYIEGVLIIDQGVVIAQASTSNQASISTIVRAIDAIKACPSDTAKLYCTLEPEHSQVQDICKALKRSGIRKIVIGVTHPNRTQAGQAIKALRAAKLEVRTGIEAQACQDLNFLSHCQQVQSQPFVAAKVALTLDGKFAAASGHSKWVTGTAARQDVHTWRRRFPAIVVGASTVVQDDPQLTARLDEEAPHCPIRCVLDTHLCTLEREPLPQLYRDQFKERTLIICSEASAQAKRSELRALGLQVWPIPCQPNGQLCLKSFVERCQHASIHGLYFEPGPRLLSSLLDDALLDYLFVYKAPKLINDQDAQGIGKRRLTQTMEAAYTLKDPIYSQLGQDYLVRGHLK
ncbi:MAG: bifunctional diaminohydroxyphosphoribosylaminopyrimidine deaminase/5-amino-6-(5-phosphoribosylamino)uracil reductase RibD [Opitutales bacterium]